MDEQHNPLKSELKFLERLSIEELEALLKLSGDPDDVELLFDTVVEEVVAREKENPTGRLPDVDTAWDELQMMYQDIPVKGGLLPSKPEGAGSAGENDPTLLAEPTADRPKRILLRKVMRTAAVMAAAIALCLALMVGAQATGVDVFGALARWTDETFRFEAWSAEPDYCEALHDTIQEALDAQGISGEFVPTWYPNGFSITNTMTMEDELGVSIRILLSDEFERPMGISVDQYKAKDFIDSQTFEIEADSVAEYPSKGRVYYILSNKSSVTASWSDGVTVHTIWGELEEKNIKLMIDSIGG